MMTENRILLLDGATGTEMMKRGMPRNTCAEAWILDHGDLLLDLERAYAQAGSQVVYAPTFSANRISLKKHGLEKDVERLNTGLVELARKAVGQDVLVAGDMTTPGEPLDPLGDLQEEELYEAYREQAEALYQAGADLIVAIQHSLPVLRRKISPEHKPLSADKLRFQIWHVKPVGLYPIPIHIPHNHRNDTEMSGAVQLHPAGNHAVYRDCMAFIFFRDVFHQNRLFIYIVVPWIQMYQVLSRVYGKPVQDGGRFFTDPL